MCVTGSSLEEGHRKGSKRQQAAPLSAPGQSSWKGYLRWHLLDQRTHVILGIPSCMDMSHVFPVTPGADLWLVTAQEWLASNLSGNQSKESTDPKALLLVVRNWEPESNTAALAPDCRPESLSSSKWCQWDSCPLQLVGSDSGILCVVLLASLTLTLGFWTPRFSKEAVNWMWRYSLWYLWFFFFKKRPLPCTAQGQINWQCFLM